MSNIIFIISTGTLDAPNMFAFNTEFQFIYAHDLRFNLYVHDSQKRNELKI